MTTVPTPSDSQDGARRRDDAGDLRERLAAIEHERWADWQRYMHGQCRPLIGAGGALVIPEGLVERWERQIATPYADLSEPEKGSDRQQVDRYWPLVAPLLAAVARLEAERDTAIELLEQLTDDDPCEYDHHDYCQTHGLHSRPCANARAIALIAAVDQTTPSSPLETPHTADGGEAGVVEGAGGSEAAEGGHMDCPERCEVPAGVRIVETPPSRHAWSDVVRCPNNRCEKTFLVILDEVGTDG